MKQYGRKFVQTRIDTPIYEKLLRAAKKEGISLSDYIRRLILQDVKPQAKVPSRA